MSEKEFEFYLKLLGRFLGLKPEQRVEIADELRDHLEERLEELTREGLSREQAIQRALDEFGDAASLADHFTQIATRRRRRLIMRCTAGSVAALTAALLISIAMWPEMRRSAGHAAFHAVGQQLEDRIAALDERHAGHEADEEMEEREELSAEDQRIRRVESKLKETTVEFEFVDMPLSEVMEFIADTMDVDILIDENALDDSSITLDEPINLVLSRTRLPAARVLELVLKPLRLTFLIRDGFVSVTTVEESDLEMEIRVYPCRDLLRGPKAASWQAAFGRGMRQPGFGSVERSDKAVTSGRRGRGSGLGRLQPDAVGRPGGGEDLAKRLADSLIEVVRQSTTGPWKGNADGTISAFNGLLVVRHNEKNHREVEHLLEMLREAHRDSEHEHDDHDHADHDHADHDHADHDHADHDHADHDHGHGEDHEHSRDEDEAEERE